MPARGADGPGPVNATLQPWRQIAFELRDAAPNALAPEFLTMRLNIWVILATLLALLLIRLDGECVRHHALILRRPLRSRFEGWPNGEGRG
jgi:hypothetical protein